MDIIATLKWLVANYDKLLNALVLLLGSLGVIVETINRLMPTQSPDSAMTKLAHFFIAAGAWVKKLMDLLRIPNNSKK